jgi:hypothetical protein
MSHDKKSWDLADLWQNYCEPARPNQSEIHIVDGIVPSGSEVLLLGSTPEFRDLLSKKKCSVTIAEYSEENFSAMTQLMKETPFSEDFHQTNWLDMKFTKKFDFILGDHIINLIPMDKWRDLVRNFKGYLKPESTLLQRVIVRPDTYNKSLSDIFVNTKVLSNKELFSNCFYDLIFSVLDSKDDSASLHDVWKLVEKAYQQKFITDKQLQYFENFGWQKSNAKGFFVRHDDLLNTLECEFTSNAIIKGELYYSDYTYFIKSE